MTAPDAVPEHTTVEQLAAALRAYHDLQPERAAVELLIAHNQGSAKWLRSDQFRACVSWIPSEYFPEEPMAQVHWTAAGRITGPATESERAVLVVAVHIARGVLADVAHTCDVHNRRLVAGAVVDALGLSWSDVMMAGQR